MKKIFYAISLSVLFILPLAPLSAQVEQIDSFKTVLQVQEDASIIVTEEIVYDFGAQDRHGIFRTIPYKYSRSGNTYNLRIKILSVTDENGKSYNYKTSKYSGYLEIKIGDADVWVTGENTYVIQYQVWRGINYFDTHDELYWNTSGNEWPVPIVFHEVEVELPEAALSGLQAVCYTGALGEENQECSIMKTREGYYFASDDSFAPYEGMSVVVGWSPGAIARPGLWQEIKWFVTDNWGLLFPIPVLIFMYWWWTRHGRDEFGRGTIIPLYEPPEGLNPAEVGTAVDGHPHMKDLSSTIIDLAQRGYIKIKYIEKKGLLGSKDYELIKLKPGDSLPNQYDREFLDALFGSKESVKVLDLKNKFYKRLPKLSKMLNETMVANKYFVRRPGETRAIYIGIGLAICVLAGFIGVITESVANGIGIGICGIIVALSSIFMVKRTSEGSIIKEKILGFQDFLKVTEEDRLKFHNAPEKKPEMFEKYLAYAMVLGVEKQWAEQFKDIYTQPPDWYEGDGRPFTTAYLVSSLSGFDSSTRSAMATRPGGGAGSGSSGFSGGGFSGGGFGGGGGGSW